MTEYIYFESTSNTLNTCYTYLGELVIFDDYGFEYHFIGEL